MRGLWLVLVVALCAVLTTVHGVPASSPSLYSSSTSSSSDGALRWAVLIDLRESNTTSELLVQALRRYVNKTMDEVGKRLFADAPTVLNSNGNLLYALSNVTALIADPRTVPDVVFLLETSDVSTSVADLLRKSSATADLLLISAHTSNGNLCDAQVNPRTVCMAPQDAINLRGLLESAASLLQWQSMALVLRNSGYGAAVQQSLLGELQAAAQAPTVVTQLFMNPATTTAEEDAMVTQLLQHRPQGIACFLYDDQMARLHAAFARAKVTQPVFLLGSREAMNVLPQLVAAGNLSDPATLHNLWGGLFVPSYTPPDALQTMGYWPAGESGVKALDHYGAFVLSYLMDGMQLIARAGGTRSTTALRAQRFDGLTGTVAFDPANSHRVPCAFSLIAANFTIANPLASWRMANYAATPIASSANAQALAALVPPSPLHAVTVCFTSAATCAEATLLTTMLYTLELLQASQSTTTTSGSNGGGFSQPPVTYLPVAINTGESGVNGLAALIPVARTCTFVAGPGRSDVALALAPVMKQYAITEVDYNAASDLLTGPRSAYPYFSRTILAERASFVGLGEVCAHFAWERVLIIARDDQLGAERARAMNDAMVRRNIHVEKTYLLADLARTTIVNTLNEVYKSAVSRIVLVLLPLGGDAAEGFFGLIDELTYMHNYVFLLSQELCLYGYIHPAARARLQSSICARADVPAQALADLNTRLAAQPALQTQALALLSNAGFEAEAMQCTLNKVPAFAGFAVDAAYVVHGAVTQALAQGVALNVSANLLRFVRGQSFASAAGNVTIDSQGARTWAAYAMDIQAGNDVIAFGVWSTQQRPSLQVDTTIKPWLWMTNETEVPLDTFRDISFVLGNSVSTSPGTIVLSVLGFIGTIAVFVFCYRHYTVQKQIELSLEGNVIPVTEEELRRLRGIKSDI